MITSILLVAAIVPFVGAIIVGQLSLQQSRVVSVLVAALTAVLCVWGVAAGFGTTTYETIGTLPWLSGYLDHSVFGLMLDPISSVLLLVATVIGLLTVLYSTSYLGNRNKEHRTAPKEQIRYYFWLLLFVGSMVGVALSPNFLQLFIFWEMTTLCSWALISFRRDDESLRAGFKALLMTHIGGLFFLIAILVLFSKTGSVQFSALGELSDEARALVFVFLMIAAWAKAAQVPLHTWLPDAMAAPTPISAYLHAAAMVKAGVYLIARVVASGWDVPYGLGLFMGAAALATILIALSFYFVQDDLKRLLAYSTIAHLGYMMLGIAMGTFGSIEGFRGGILHLICHGFSKATLFFCVGSVAFITGSRSISAISGLGRSMPLTATAFFIGVLSVAGVPPFACFWSKFMIFQGVMRLPSPLGPALLVILLCETLLAFAWMLHIAQKVFLGKPSPVAQVNSEPPLPMSITTVVLIIGCVVIPLVGIPLVDLIGR